MVYEGLVGGLIVSGIGVAIVFAVLTILVILVEAIKYTLYRPRKTIKEKAPEEKIKEAGERGEKPETGKGIDPITASIIASAIAGFSEYKYMRLRKYEIFRDFPQLIKLLSLTGTLFKAKIKVSLGGKDVVVEVMENPDNTYIVDIGGKKYSVSYIVKET